MPHLPIQPVLPDIRRALGERGSAVLQAPPGAGKTTLVPIALLNAPWLAGRKIVMLEPRRLAARAAARRMADLLGEEVGETVGYRVRLDSKVGARTRVEVVTEGILTRRVQNDPGLEGVGILIFDEFHERSVHADLGLALALDARDALRPDLRVLVMSATIDTAPVAGLLGGAPVIKTEGRIFPVETRYIGRTRGRRAEDEAAEAVLSALRDEPGSVLVFLPGAGEIRRVEARLRRAGLPEGTAIAPLYGNLTKAEQDEAIRPVPADRRKVVLATSIAETSLTIEGVRVVVDSGLMRVPRFDPRSGMTRLATQRVTRDAADQRRGRAGRTEPGVCYRLWDAATQRGLLDRRRPEILSGDLAFVALEMARWGASDPRALRWLDPPPKGAYRQAVELLERLGALDKAGRVTEHGRAMSEAPVHPRSAHMILRAREMGLGGLACELAALTSERDILTPQAGHSESDLRLRVEALRTVSAGGHFDAQGYRVDRSACRSIARLVAQWRRTFRIEGQPGDPEAAGRLLALAYPDRVGRRREGDDRRYALTNGRGARFPTREAVCSSEFIVAASLDAGKVEARVFLAAPISRGGLRQMFADRIETVESVEWDARSRCVAARRSERLDRLILSDAPLPDPDPAAVTAALIEGIRQEGLGALPWDKKTRAWRDRVAFLRRVLGEDSGWPDVSDETLLANIEAWLAPWVSGMRSLADLRKLDLRAALESLLAWPQRRALDDLAPTHLRVPSGSRRPIEYASGEPTLAVRVQEMFGATETPRVAGGRVPVAIELLSPAQRPVQVTKDLASFWATAYAQVRKDLRGRYPRHHWPEDPLSAKPTQRAKPRKR